MNQNSQWFPCDCTNKTYCKTMCWQVSVKMLQFWEEIPMYPVSNYSYFSFVCISLVFAQFFPTHLNIKLWDEIVSGPRSQVGITMSSEEHLKPQHKPLVDMYSGFLFFFLFLRTALFILFQELLVSFQNNQHAVTYYSFGYEINTEYFLIWIYV